MSLAEDARALVERTTREQGLPFYVEDLGVLAKVRATIGLGKAPEMSAKELRQHKLRMAEMETQRRVESQRKAALAQAAEASMRSEVIDRWASDCSPEQVAYLKKTLEW